MQIAAEFFQSVDVNKRLKLHSAADLWKWIEGGGTEGLVSDPWVLNPGQDTFFRGQASAQYGISSKLYRDCLTAAKSAGRTAIAESDLAAAERVILSAMREEGIGRRMSEGEMLMVLQHHGIATRLLDVSASPKEALFFACDQHGEQDGRFFVFSLSPDGDPGGGVDQLALGEAKTLPWSGVAVGSQYATGDWTQRVAVVSDAALDPRMRAQNGRFLVGGLARRYAGKRRRIGGQDLLGGRFIEPCTLDVNFLKVPTSAHSSTWGASGWSIHVPAEWKVDLMHWLAKEDEPITPDTMYPPLHEVGRLARRLLIQHFESVSS